MMRSESEDPRTTGISNRAFEGDKENDELRTSNGRNGVGPDGFQNVVFTTASDDVFISSLPEKKEVVTQPSKLDTKTEKRYMYGWCMIKPKFLQKTNRIGIFVFWAVLLCLLQGFAVNGIGNASLPHIEKQFGLPSSKSALITSSQDIGALIVVLFISFIGSRYNKASWVASGSLIMAVGSLLFMVPHMASDAPVLGSPNGASGAGVCYPGKNSTSGTGPASGSSSGLSHFLGVFMVAQMVHGIGFCSMFTLGTVYIDENEKPTTAAVFVGMTYAAAAVGVACGFFFGGQFTEKFYVDFDRVDQSSLDFGPRDPQWIGAWWVGFIISIIVFVIIAFPLYGFPRAIPGSEKHLQETQETKDSADNTPAILSIKETVVGFFKAVLKFIVNVELIFLCLGATAEMLIISGVGAFSFKFLAEQYDMPFDQAGYLIGGLILCSAFGMLLGGILIRVLKLEGLGMERLSVAMCVVTAILGCAALAKCPNVRLAGLEIPYPGESSVMGYSSTCQGSCDCEDQVYSPVCGKDDIVYYSPCHAGCLIQNSPGPSAMYGNCSCVAKSLNVSLSEDTATAKRGRCDTGCKNVYILAPFLFIMLLAVLTTTTPTSMATLRCVEPKYKPFALGFQWMLMRLLGAIPGPILIGWVLDTSCEIWSPASPDGTKFCMLYSKHRMSLGVFMWWICVNLAGALFFFIASLACARKNKSVDLKT